jgi:hypothetical protein
LPVSKLIRQPGWLDDEWRMADGRRVGHFILILIGYDNGRSKFFSTWLPKLS